MLSLHLRRSPPHLLQQQLVEVAEAAVVVEVGEVAEEEVSLHQAPDRLSFPDVLILRVLSLS